MNEQELYRVMEQQYFGDEIHEQEEIALLPSLLTGVKLFVDVGASLGQYAYYTGQSLNQSRIICVEADPVRYKRLSELANKWQREGTNTYQIVHAAAADVSGEMPFYVTGECISGGLFKHHVPDPTVAQSLEWREITVPVVTLDELCTDSPPDLIKIDVEGAEYRVLKGAEKILGAGHARFLVEVHPWGDEAARRGPSDVFALFDTYGYDCRRTHRHWHFFKPAKRTFWQRRKMRAIMWSYPHLWLKNILKTIILKTYRKPTTG